MRLLDEISTAADRLREQQVSIDDAESLAKQAKQAANKIYSFMHDCEAMCPVSEEELDDAIGTAGVWALIDAGVLQINNAKFRRWKGKA